MSGRTVPCGSPRSISADMSLNHDRKILGWVVIGGVQRVRRLRTCNAHGGKEKERCRLTFLACPHHESRPLKSRVVILGEQSENGLVEVFNTFSSSEVNFRNNVFRRNQILPFVLALLGLFPSDRFPRLIHFFASTTLNLPVPREVDNFDARSEPPGA